jgi:hypothetical protein
MFYNEGFWGSKGALAPLLQKDVRKYLLTFTELFDAYIIAQSNVQGLSYLAQSRGAVYSTTSALAHSYIRLADWAEKRGALPPNSYHNAILSGNLNYVQWVYSRGLKVYPNDLFFAVKFNHLSILQWLVNSFDHQTIEWQNWNFCDRATQNGNLEMLKFLRNPPNQPSAPWSNTSECYECYGAVYDGNLEILQWLIENGAPYNIDMLLHNAEMRNHHHVVEWLRKGPVGTGCPFKTPEKGRAKGTFGEPPL